MYEFKLPDIGEGMHEGEIRRWLVQVGQRVAADEPLVEVQTDKVTAELTAPVEGVIAQLCVAEGSVVPVGTVLAVLATDEQAGSACESAITPGGADTGSAARKEAPRGDGLAVGPALQGPAQEVAAAQAAAASMPAPRPGRRALATPHVRALARKLRLNIDDIPGTGPAGRVTEEDVQRYAAAQQARYGGQAAEAAPAAQTGAVSAVATSTQAAQAAHVVQTLPSTADATADHAAPTAGAAASALAARTGGAAAEPVDEVPLRGIRRRIAEHMVRSVRTIPHVTHVDEIEMEALDALRKRLRPAAEARGVKLTFLSFFIKALTVALREFPYLNASVDDAGERILLKRYYHIGVAVDTEEGLIVPVVKHADQKSLFDIAAEVGDLAARARAGRLALHEVTGSTFTVSNVGPIGGLYATPIINHPEAAILGLHKMEPRAVVRDGELVIRKMMYISLSFDHRIIDGAMAVRFTNRVKSLLEQPETLWAELR